MAPDCSMILAESSWELSSPGTSMYKVVDELDTEENEGYCAVEVVETSQIFSTSMGDELASESVRGTAETTEIVQMAVDDKEGSGFTPILLRRERRQARRQKRVTFNEKVEVYYIESCNIGRKVCEITSPAKPAPPSRPTGKKLYRCVTANGTVFVEMDPIAAAYLSYIQQERHCGRQVLVKDFFKEAKIFAAAQEQQLEEESTYSCAEDTQPDIDLYSASKQRYRRPRQSRKYQQQQQQQQQRLLPVPKEPCPPERSPDGSNSDDTYSEPDIPSVSKEVAVASDSPRPVRREGKRNQLQQNRPQYPHLDQPQPGGYVPDSLEKQRRSNVAQAVRGCGVLHGNMLHSQGSNGLQPQQSPPRTHVRPRKQGQSPLPAARTGRTRQRVQQLHV